jgi:hypothetical protein
MADLGAARKLSCRSRDGGESWKLEFNVRER